MLQDLEIAVLVPKNPEQIRLEGILEARQQQLAAMRQNSKNLVDSSDAIDSDKLYKQYIDKLHAYNEIKDATQCLLGKLAEINKCTINEMHSNYGLSQIS